VSDEKAFKDRAEQLIALQKKQSLASRLDLRSARELRDASDDHRLQPLFMRNFFMRAYSNRKVSARLRLCGRSGQILAWTASKLIFFQVFFVFF
jgi:hypothetical protein